MVSIVANECMTLLKEEISYDYKTLSVRVRLLKGLIELVK